MFRSVLMIFSVYKLLHCAIMLSTSDSAKTRKYSSNSGYHRMVNYYA